MSLLANTGVVACISVSCGGWCVIEIKVKGKEPGM